MRYFSGRLIQAGLLLLGASILTFLFSSLAPGSYFDEMRLNPRISPATVAALRAEYQPDRPLPVLGFARQRCSEPLRQSLRDQGFH